MTGSIKDKVAIIGMGCTKFGERWNSSAEDLMVEAFKECTKDAQIEKGDIEAAWLSSCYEEAHAGKMAAPLAETLKLPFIPVTRVENYCTGGSEALRAAAYGVASGSCDIALALGVEKLKDTGYGGLQHVAWELGPERRVYFPNFTAPGSFAMLANSYFDKYGIDPEEGKKMIGKVSVKSHYNGALHPKAHFRRELSLDDVINAPIVAWPLGLFDCCPVTDGASAAIIVPPDKADEYTDNPVYIKASQVAVTPGEEVMYPEYDYTYVKTTTRAAERAYKEAGVKNPREEISMAEVHDCFSITEAVTMEDLQFSPRGKVKEDIENGRFELDGEQPIQPDGGLKSFGHPISASGLRMMYEMYNQFQGKAGERQVEDPKLGLTHNLGGIPFRSVASVIIVGR